MNYKTIAIAAVLALASVTGPAAAQSDESVWDSMGETVCNPAADGVSTLDCITAANSNILSIAERGQYKVATSSVLGSPDTKADEYATEVADTYNANNESIENYTNSRFDGDASEHNVIELEFEASDETSTRYLVADVDSEDNFTNSQVVNSTDRTADHTVTFHDFAAADASDELQRFVDEYVTEDRNIDPALVNRLGNRYGGDVDLPEELRP